jgi:hypothetical protein
MARSRPGLRRDLPLLPARDCFLCWNRLGGAITNGFGFLVVARSACRDDRQPPDMQEPLKSSVAGRIVCTIYSVVVLVEKLGAFWLAQVPEDDLRIIGILNLDGPDRHAINATPERERRSADAVLRVAA